MAGRKLLCTIADAGERGSFFSEGSEYCIRQEEDGCTKDADDTAIDLRFDDLGRLGTNV